MDKKTFLNKMSFVDNSIASKIYDKIILTQRTTRTTYTSELYTPDIYKTLEHMSSELDVKVNCYGVFEDAQRKIIAFSEEDVWYYPIDLLKISTNAKFTKLEHKDYLGAIMALGIKREKLGDLILKNDECYLAVHNEITDYIKMNLTSVGKSTCTINILDVNSSEIPVYDFQNIIVNVSSLRIDCVVSALCNISRGKAEELIRQGKVLIDYSEALRKDKILKEDCIITIRGYGKFKILEEAGWTGSGRVKIQVKKFI
ncbi:MAG: RNA-binding protein [Clostridiaceae bacterium]|nr:RNA-binding protein [Clostridiaceae bacterium]